jgi:DMSO/TMAO reductase YedYZ molybdopterin-dependent catalytic subunit
VDITVDLRCITKWSKPGTRWRCVFLDTLMAGVTTAAEYAVARAVGDYSTSLPPEDLLDGKAWIAFRYDDADLEPEHGGPARLLVPHLCPWKSARHPEPPASSKAIIGRLVSWSLIRAPRIVSKTCFSAAHARGCPAA